MLTPFRNEPYPDFALDTNARLMVDALDTVRSRSAIGHPIIIAGEPIETGRWIVSTNPAHPDQEVGRVARATPEIADRAVRAAWDAFGAWRTTDPSARARCLLKAAAILRRRAYEFSALLVLEVGKSWIEAYADTAEAVDFLEFYAREMIRLGGSHPTTPFSGEENEVRYLPLGVAVVISPWNFPLAIMAGMTCAAAVTGNTVVVKPASQAPVVAAVFMDVLREASVPPGVVNFVPGSGAEIGDVLVDHPLTRLVSFTGSKDVGLRIHQRAAIVHPGQKWLKRAVLEMGGKDAIVVDATADPDAAAAGAVASAFGYQGQKCSACSRLIVESPLYDEVLDRVIAKASKLTVADPSERRADVGPLIEGAARDKVLQYVAIGRSEGRLAFEQSAVPDEGYFVGPTVIADVEPNARIAQEEIFGPVLAVLRADSFPHALEIANGTEYGLTGALYSRDRDHIEQARREFHVGNLYINRKCTGALVDVQPFGGFNMSGTDSKAGGRDYLQLFMQAKSVCERF